MDTKIDDLTGQPIKRDDCWTVKITNPATKLTLQIDTKQFDSLETMVKTAVANGQQWFKWVQNDNGDGVHKEYPDETESRGSQ